MPNTSPDVTTDVGARSLKCLYDFGDGCNRRSGKSESCTALYGRLTIDMMEHQGEAEEWSVETSPDRAVDHSRAMGPPPVSSARWSVPSNHRGDMTQL